MLRFRHHVAIQIYAEERVVRKSTHLGRRRATRNEQSLAESSALHCFLDILRKSTHQLIQCAVYPKKQCTALDSAKDGVSRTAASKRTRLGAVGLAKLRHWLQANVRLVELEAVAPARVQQLHLVDGTDLTHTQRERNFIV